MDIGAFPNDVPGLISVVGHAMRSVAFCLPQGVTGQTRLEVVQSEIAVLAGLRQTTPFMDSGHDLRLRLALTSRLGG